MPTIPNIQSDPLLPDYRYNRAAGRYIDENGRFVSQQAIRSQLDLVLDSITADMVDLSRRFRAGEVDGATWQMESMKLIKQSHLAGAAMEKGGWFNMSQNDFGRVGQIIRREYGYFNDLLAEITNGTQKLDGTLDNRMRLYGQAGRMTYHAFERVDRMAQGYDQERSILHARDHCTDADGPRGGCLEEAAKGWQPIGTMIPVGRRNCLSNDRCTVAFRNSATGETIG